MTLRALYLDLNSFFASCEQQEDVRLRGKPVAVVPLMSDFTCAIAASYEAKAYGIKTGTLIAEAKRLCPDIVLIPACHRKYVEYHHRVLCAVDRCIPVDKVRSIDEVSCRLDKTEQTPEVARRLALRIKEAIREEAGICLTSSIGIAPNVLLAKIASDMQKPDGLVILNQSALPEALHTLKLTDFPGIGPRMQRRLWKHGIYDAKALLSLDSLRMRAIWGGVGGARYHAQLHGLDFADFTTEPSVIGHQHVLEPELRTKEKSPEVMRRLTVKAAERLRGKAFYCCSLSVHVKLAQRAGYLEDARRFCETQDTRMLLHMLEDIWHGLGDFFPHRVGVNLSGLIPATAHQSDLFEPRMNRNAMQAVDAINQRFGRGTITFGLNPTLDAKMQSDKISFQRVPKLYELPHSHKISNP